MNTSNFMQSAQDHGMSRREFSAALAVAFAAAGVGPALGQEKSISAVMPGVVLFDETRAVLDKQIGIKVENVPYVSPTDTVAKLLAPGGTSRYDMMVSNTFFVKGPILGAKSGDEKVAAFDMAKLPHVADMQKLFRDDMQTRDGKFYTVPIFWGYDSPIINTTHIPVDDPLTQSWGVLFSDKYAGRVALRDDAYQSLMITGLHLGHKNPATMTRAELADAKKFLISKKKNFRTFWTNFGQAVSLMSSGEVWAMYGWMPMRAALQRDGIKATNAWPSDGLLVWNHAAFIPKDTRKIDLTHQVINAMLSPEFGETLTRIAQYGPVSSKALEKFPPDQQRTMGIDVPSRGVKLYELQWPNDMNAWIETWAEFKAA